MTVRKNSTVSLCSPASCDTRPFLFKANERDDAGNRMNPLLELHGQIARLLGQVLGVRLGWVHRRYMYVSSGSMGGEILTWVRGKCELGRVLEGEKGGDHRRPS